jgi:hypothetical protein
MKTSCAANCANVNGALCPTSPPIRNTNISLNSPTKRIQKLSLQHEPPRAVNPFQQFAASPYANTLVRDLAVSFIAGTDFGKNDTPDVLSIAFTARPFSSNGSILPVEKEDMLLRLDRDMSPLSSLS